MDSVGWDSLLPPAQHSARELRDGELLFRQGEPVRALYMLRAGSLRLLRVLEDGTTVTLYVARPGETLAEASLFAEHYHCDAVAQGNCQVLALPKAALRQALETNPQTSLALSRQLARQVRDLRAQLELRNVKSAPLRLLAWLRLQAAGSPPTVQIDRPWNVVATEIGLTHEAVYRALNQLQRAGQIERRQRLITLRSS